MPGPSNVSHLLIPTTLRGDFALLCIDEETNDQFNLFTQNLMISKWQVPLLPTTQPQAVSLYARDLETRPWKSILLATQILPQAFLLKFLLANRKKNEVWLLCGTPVAVFYVEVFNKLGVRPLVGKSLEAP